MNKWITAFMTFALCLLLASCGIVEKPNVDFDNTGAENSSSTTVPNTVSTETKETFMIWDLDPKDHYVLKFSDAS